MKERANGLGRNDRALTLVLMIVVVGLLNADQNLINSTSAPSRRSSGSRTRTSVS